MIHGYLIPMAASLVTGRSVNAVTPENEGSRQGSPVHSFFALQLSVSSIRVPAKLLWHAREDAIGDRAVCGACCVHDLADRYVLLRDPANKVIFFFLSEAEPAYQS